MKIESLIRITGGVLLNSPSVNSIDEIKINSQKVLRGNLFIDINNSPLEISEAVKNGAYCILSSQISQIKDDEIAWIHTDNLNLSIIKLSRFHTTNKKFQFIPLSNIQYKLAKCLKFDTKAQTLSIQPENALMQIQQAKDESIFFVVESSFIEKIDPTVILPKKEFTPKEIFEKGIFQSSFIYNDLYVKDLRLSSLFITYLCSLLEYLDHIGIEYSIENFNNLEHFIPQFINDKLEKKEFGTTSKALIFENDYELFLKELTYIQNKVTLNSLIIFVPKSIINEFTCNATKVAYSNFIDIKFLQDKDFKYALIYGNIHDFEDSLQTHSNRQMNLF